MSAIPAPPTPVVDRSLHVGRFGALGVMAGIVLSGPLAIAVVEAVAPQPPWSGAATYAAHFSPLQVLPYVAGLLLVSASVALVAGAALAARPERRGRALMALVLAAVFATMIIVNYTVQLALVPALVASGDPRHHVLLDLLSMGNPTSLAWALEMVGYGVLGVATWLVAPIMADLGSRWAARAFVANGVTSVAGAVWTALDPGWEMSPLGLVVFAAWNVVLFVAAALARPVFRPGAAGRDGAFALPSSA
ncbi:MAG: hypothetical protein IT385_30310 [Deltaproteobacteria bacterium]|nr:hypothetical protein [Deltaproteobacteria bacterium]